LHYKPPYLAPELKGRAHSISHDVLRRGSADDSFSRNGGTVPQNSAVMYDVLSADMYAVAVNFLVMKYLLPEKERVPDIIREKIALLNSEESTSALVINTLMNDNPMVRLNNSYESLSRLIQNNLMQVKKFRELVLKNNQKVRALNIFPRYK
jgi:hypothetical protein